MPYLCLASSQKLLSLLLCRKPWERCELSHPRAPPCPLLANTVIASFPPGLEPTGVLTFIASMWVCSNTLRLSYQKNSSLTIKALIMLLDLHAVGLQIPLENKSSVYHVVYHRKLKSRTIKTEKPKMAQQTTTKVINACVLSIITTETYWCCIRKTAVSSVFTSCQAGLTFLCFLILVKTWRWWPNGAYWIIPIDLCRNVQSRPVVYTESLSAAWFDFPPVHSSSGWPGVLCSAEERASGSRHRESPGPPVWGSPPAAVHSCQEESF